MSSRDNKARFVRFCAFQASVLMLAVGCATPEYPNTELVLAREAFASATEVDAAKFAPGNYDRADEAFRRAMNLYKKGDFKAASQEFRVARHYAERAENAARVQRQKSGEEGM